jgi:benzil reductase ((S)-benzoin forming)
MSSSTAPSSVLITGVSSGIGLGLAKACLARGDRVYGVSRRYPTGLEGNPRFVFVSVDLTRFEVVPPALDRLLAGVERLDTVVLNAGVLGEIKDLSETSMQSVKEVMDINLWANKAVLDALFARKLEIGQVVAISSGAAVKGARGRNAYSISKAALNMLIELYASERPDIHFSAIAPGTVDTAMQDYVRDLPDDGRFDTVTRLKRARGTKDMPFPDELAPRLLEAFMGARKAQSGKFHDIRAMG